MTMPAEPATDSPFSTPAWPGMPTQLAEVKGATDWEAWAGQDVPCDVVIEAKTRQECGQPAVVRVKTRCAGCGKRYKFYCQRHYEELRAETIVCVVCKSTLQEVGHEA